jgi:hypothetical protein
MDELEVLEPAFASRSEASPLVRSSQRSWRETSRGAIRFAVELRQLYERSAHTLYGYSNFSAWAEQTYEGLGSSSVKQFTRAGAVALALDRHNRLSLVDPTPTIGTTGLRDLSTVLNSYNEDTMVQVFDLAQQRRPEQPVSGDAVKEAARQLEVAPPPKRKPIPVPDPPEDDADDDDFDPEEDEDEIELHDRIDALSDRLMDLRTLSDNGRLRAYTEAAEEWKAIGELLGEK